MLTKLKGLLGRAYRGSAFRLTLLSLIAQAMNFLSAPLITRLYSPADFGALGVFASIVNCCSAVACLRYELAIMVEESDQNAVQLARACLLCLLSTTFSLALFLHFGESWLMTWQSIRSLGPHLSLLVVGHFFIGLFVLFDLWSIREGNYVGLGQARIVQALSQITIQVGLGQLHLASFGLLLGQIASSSAGALKLGWSALSNRTPWNFDTIWSLYSKHRRFPLYTIWPSLFKLFGSQGPVLFLAQFYGEEVTGWYALSQRVITVPTAIIGDSLCRVFLGEASKAGRSDTTQLRHIFFKAARTQLVVGLLLIVPLGLISPWLFPKLFGARWAAAGQYTFWLSVMNLSLFFSAPMEQVVLLLERQDLYAVQETLRMSLLIAPIVLVATQHGSPETAIWAMSLGGALAGLVNSSIAYYSVVSHTSRSPISEPS